MKKSKFIILLIVIVVVIWGFVSKNPNLKGFYQSEVNGYHIQMLIRKEDNSFVEWIDNREVDRGTYEKVDTNSYRIKSNKQSFEIGLNDDNSFEIIINKLNDGKPIIMKNITKDDHRVSFGEWDDVDEYESLLD
ncbi:hypothetical protein Amet_2255 [Alkaliphilus metalliredigens QYMF]|uniref:Uncharacterized protein n=1 Tax=Alkaliphilus metalliredigens (strain QYMF) TaxID=293826 RepID=A6TQE5_ALKMQ|nr:hypothetical protein [Alkaliphilus metalliredigens]ABR48413.1 hypothetical protein Amet_2255 [Alkaliphilus metalliredigens QYMF]